MKTIIATTNAPAALGPYSQAVRKGNIIMVSGQLGLNPATGEMAGPDVEAQTIQALKNLQAVLEAAGAKPRDVVKTTVFLDSMDDFGAVNKLYAEVFFEEAPARSCVEVACLPKNAKVEIEAIAII